jgi:ligand-binding sensor domain-containing protein/signal transduction histidine kinase/DNA-binding response OmpR family regulator
MAHFRLACLSCILLFLPEDAIAQVVGGKFYGLMTRETLPNNSVIAISQDSAGYMWFGTYEGLCRYDAHRLRYFKHNPEDSSSLSSNIITTLLTRRNGEIWVGTSNGLNLWNPAMGTFKRYFYQNSASKLFKYLTIYSIYEDTDAILWVGTSAGLYKMVDKTSDTFIKLSSLGYQGGSTEKNIAGICGDQQGAVYVASGMHIVKYGKNGRRLGQFNYATFLKDKWRGDWIRSIAIDRQQRIWIGGQMGLKAVFDCKSNSFLTLESQKMGKAKIETAVYNILPAPNGMLWFSSGSGAACVNTSTGVSRKFLNDVDDPTSLSDNNVLSTYVSNEGVLWVGTYNSGVQYALPNDNKFYMIPGRGGNGLSYGVVTSVAAYPDNELAIGTGGGGVNLLDQNNRINGLLRGLNSKDISTLTIDRGGSLWVGSNGLSKLESTKSVAKHYQHDPTVPNSIASNKIYKMIEDSRGRLWIGTQKGLDLFDRDTETFKHVDLGSKDMVVLTIFEDSKENIWIGAFRSHVYVMRKGAANIERVPVLQLDGSHSVEEGSSVLAIHEDMFGNIWLGGYAIKLKKFNPNKNVFEEGNFPELYNKTQHIINIESDKKGRLWLGMAGDLALVDVKGKVTTLFGKAEGIDINEFTMNSSYKSKQGLLYFGTNKGLLYFDPQAVELNKVASSVKLTDFEVNGKSVFPGDGSKILEKEIAFTKKIALSHNQNFFKISFSLLNYVHSEKNLFEYKLGPVDPTWRKTKDPSVTFNNLAPGTYKLLVRAYNNDNMPSSNSAELEIVVLPPIWQSGWAYGLYAIVIMAIIMITFRILWVRAYYKQTLDLQKIKMKFFTNISHEIRTHLALIIGPLDKSLAATSPQAAIYRNLQLAHINAGRLLGLVTELMDFSKLENRQVKLQVSEQNVVGAIHALLPIFENITVEKQVHVEVVAAQEPVMLFYDQFQFEKAIFNLLSNAFKFVEYGGNIWIKVLERQDVVSIQIVDNGKGVAFEHLDKLFDNYFQVYEYGGENTGYGIGLALTKEIVELHHGTLTVESHGSAPGSEKYTCFEISMPKGSGHFNETQIIHTIATSSAAPNVMAVSSAEPRAAKLDEMNGSGTADTVETILIAEDNPGLLGFIASCFPLYHIIQCDNGIDALERAQEVLPDLVITDIMMPALSGIELCKKLKEDMRTSHIPVIMLTAKASAEQMLVGLESSADHYITKPFNVRELELKVANLLNLKKALQARARNVSSIDGLKDTASNNLDKEFLNKLVMIIEENMADEEFGVDLLAHEIGMGRTTLYKKVKAVTGLSINDFIRSQRISNAARLLRTNIYNVTEVSEKVGINDRRYFTKEFSRMIGKTPSQYAKDFK